MQRLPSALAGLLILAGLAGFVGLIYAWEVSFTNSNSLVVYFGRPSEVPPYLASNWNYLFWASSNCLLTAIASLFLAGVVAIALLAIGLLNDSWLKRMEWFAVASQAIPLVVIVILFLQFEMMIFGDPTVGLPTIFYSLPPVTVSLIFPPLVNGGKSIVRTQLQIKSLLRLWHAPTQWRIFRVYLPSALPDVLTGLRTSATWAVGATLISDGLLDGVAVDARTLGHLLLRPFSSAPPRQTPTVIVTATLLAFGVYYLFDRAQRLVERRLLGSVVQEQERYSLQQ